MKKISKEVKDIIAIVVIIIVAIAGWFISDIFISNSNISDNVRNVAKQAVTDCDYFLDDKMTLITFNAHMEGYGEQIEVIKGMTTDWDKTDNCDVEDIINNLKEASEKYQVEKIKDELKKLIR